MIVFDKGWFNKHQNVLLKLANTSVGRQIFGIKKKPFIVSISPSRYLTLDHIDRGTNTAIIKGKYCTEPVYARNLHKNLRLFWWALHTIDSLILDHQRLVPNFGFETLLDYETWYGGGPDSWDQAMYVGSNSSTTGYTWATCKAKTSADYVKGADTYIVETGAKFSADLNIQNLFRAQYCFQLGTDVPAGADLISAYLTCHPLVDGYVTATGAWSAANSLIQAVDTDIADPTTDMEAGDWDTYDFVSPLISGDEPYIGDVQQYVDVVFNMTSTKLAAYNYEEYYQIGLVLKADRLNITPTPSVSGYWYMVIGEVNSSLNKGNYFDVAYVLPSEYLKINVGDAWKSSSTEIYINIGDAWKRVAAMKINIGDVWKDIF